MKKTKLQTPNLKKNPSTEFQIGVFSSVVWRLRFEICLGFRIWGLGFFIRETA